MIRGSVKKYIEIFLYLNIIVHSVFVFDYISVYGDSSVISIFF